MEKITIKSLMSLPKRKENWETISKSCYDSIMIFNSRRKHGSGYAIMNIVGCIDMKPIELISGYCDSIEWNFNNLQFRTDMIYPCGAIHFFGCKFEVGRCLSTTTIKLIKEKQN
jgi:hypothetical protein